jgi:exopolysaccharide production protein ExoQ
MNFQSTYPRPDVVTPWAGIARRDARGSILAWIGVILLMSAVTIGPHANALKEEGATGLIRQGTYIGLLVLAMLSVRPWRNPAILLCVPAPLVLAVAVCAISLTWSAVPGIGFRRLTLTATIIWTIAILVRQLGDDRFVSALRWALFALLIANYVAVFAFPTFGIHQFGDRIDIALVGDWCGVMMHKNFAGAVMAVTVCFFLFDAGRVNLLVRIAIIAAASVFLIFSESKTSVGMLVGSALAGYLFGKISFSWRLALIPMIAIGFVLLMIYLNLYRYVFVQLVTDPVTFTGRIIIWRHLFSYIVDNPLFGTGYGSFWNVGEEGPIFRYSSDWVRTQASGHNGYLDLAATLGIPLAIVVVGLLVVWPFVRILISHRTTGGRGALLLSLLIFCVGHNVTEASMMERDVIPNVVLIIAITLLWDISSRRKSFLIGRGGGVLALEDKRLDRSGNGA